VFELEDEIQSWRTRVERSSSLSARELDELEDHLRARVSLELDLNPALAPAKAFTAALTALGEPKAISREFARAGRPRWRRFLLAGWGLYAVSFVLPAVILPAEAQVLGLQGQYGYEVFWEGLTFPNLFVALANLAMIGTLSALWTARSSKPRRFLRSLQAIGNAGIGLVTLGTGILQVVVPVSSPYYGPVYLGPAYWAFSTSFACVAVALWLRNKDSVSARPLSESSGPHRV
jgi:hypothetical protein